jgi:hypothetical protein
VIIDLLVIGALFSWLILSILAQRRPTRVFKYDRLGLLPNYRFFAPRPISYDLFLVTRAYGEDGVQEAWRFYDIAQKGLWCFIWNPRHRLRKGITDLISSLRQHRDVGSLHLTHAYLVLLNLTTARYRMRGHVAKVQFALVRSNGYEGGDPEMFFLFHIHAVSN